MHWRASGSSHSQRIATAEDDGFSAALTALQTVLQAESSCRQLHAVAHRVVHGGEVYRRPTLVTADVLEKLGQLNALAPLHQPHNVEGIRAFAKFFPELPQVACFDTAFHADLPDVELNFALPQSLSALGIRRFGFHGLSYQFVIQALDRLSARGRGRVVMAHLGSGASVCGAYQGKSCATSMGFSALDGLIMGTRSGSLDAGVVLHLLSKGWDHARLENLLYRQSGLLGVSGISGDMRELRKAGSASADLAIRMFVYRVAREIGAIAASIGGMDVLAFTGGIGEHDYLLRAQVCEQLKFLGIRIDSHRNAAECSSDPVAFHSSESSVEVWMIPTDEGRIAAQEAATLLQPENA
jgi:acetate kinase